MIPRSEASWQVPWQQELQHLITDPQDLLQRVGLDMTHLPAAKAAAKLFPLRATRPFVAKIERGNWQDPLLRQILPLGEELTSPADYSDDPLQEKQTNPVAGVVHKYKSRVLLIAASQCAINCRYCFRRSFPYEENRLNKQQWQNALKYIAAHPEVNEVILSGGDPLSISDNQLLWLMHALAKIPHLTRVRVHTRFPVVLPQRLTAELINALTATRLKPVMVLHCNHAQEVDSELQLNLEAVKKAGITLLNQSVLLKGVNNTPEALVTLSETLFAAGVMPYYLHLLDKVKGAAHFFTPEHEARALMQNLLAELPGFLVPKLVREEPNQPSKTPIKL